MSEQVGDKMAKLGDMHNRLGLAIPDGFVITTQAFFEFMNQNGLLEKAEQAVTNWDANDEAALEKLAGEMQDSILNTPVPRQLTAQIFAQFDALAGRIKRPKVYIAMRSSAWGEGGDASFSGQYDINPQCLSRSAHRKLPPGRGQCLFLQGLELPAAQRIP